MSQLKELEASGLINRNVIKEMPPKIVVYEINKEYSDIVDIVVCLPQRQRHIPCRHAFLGTQLCDPLRNEIFVHQPHLLVT